MPFQAIVQCGVGRSFLHKLLIIIILYKCIIISVSKTVHFHAKELLYYKLKMLQVSSVALLLALASGSAIADESSECPNWYHRPPGSHHCQCGPTLKGGIMCSENGVYLHVEMGYSQKSDNCCSQ